MDNISIMRPGTMLKNTIVFGKGGSGKTTHIIKMLEELLLKNPGLKIGVCEEYPEIQSVVPDVVVLSKPSAELDLFVCTYDYLMIAVAQGMNVSVWGEISGDEKSIEIVKKNMPCIREYDYIQMKSFEVV